MLTPASAQQQAPPAAEEATTLAQQGHDPAQFPTYVEQLKQQVHIEGISDATITAAFANVRFVDRVIKSDRNQLEKKNHAG